jgi:hypothetical protein
MSDVIARSSKTLKVVLSSTARAAISLSDERSYRSSTRQKGGATAADAYGQGLVTASFKVICPDDVSNPAWVVDHDASVAAHQRIVSAVNDRRLVPHSPPDRQTTGPVRVPHGDAGNYTESAWRTCARCA